MENLMTMRNLLAPFIATAAVGLVALAPSNSYAEGFRHHSRSSFSIGFSTPGFSIGFSSGYVPRHYYAPAYYSDPYCYEPAPVVYVERPVYRRHYVRTYYRPSYRRSCF